MGSGEIVSWRKKVHLLCMALQLVFYDGLRRKRRNMLFLMKALEHCSCTDNLGVWNQAIIFGYYSVSYQNGRIGLKLHVERCWLEAV